MAFSAPASTLLHMADALAESTLSGINPSTAAADDRSWQLWITVCEAHGTSPLRTAADARDFPQRNAHLLAALMLHAFVACRPRAPNAEYIKPRSALAYPLAIIRIHARWGISLPSHKALKASLHHLSRLYLSIHGALSLAPRRAEPMRFNMVIAMNQLPFGTAVNSAVWDDAAHDVFVFRRLSPFLFETAHRLAEVVGPTGYLTFGNVVWVIDSRVVVSPTAAQLSNLVPNRDYALVSPPLAKSDQFGEIHCAYPTALLFHDEPANAAAAIRDLELRLAPKPTDRLMKPLFPSASGQPYTHSFLDRLLKGVLRATFGDATALVFTWHSYRVGLATALYAAGVPDAEIQLYCRWLCADSLRLYRRIGATQRDLAVQAARQTHVHALQTPNAHRVANSEAYAAATAAPTSAQMRAFALSRAAKVRETHALPPLPAAQQRNVPNVSGDHAYGTLFRAATRFTAEDFSPAHADADPAAPRSPAAPSEAPSKLPVALAPVAMWPSQPCNECDGRGWLVEVLARHGPTSLIRFLHARDPAGRPYLPVRVLSAELLPAPPSGS